MTRVLDASVLIGHLDPTDRHHPAATAALLEAADAEVLIHPLNLAECLVGAVRTGREHVVMQSLHDMGIEVAGVDGDAPVRIARLRVATGLRLPDCCALDVARQHEAALVTFDDGQRVGAAKVGIAVV